MKLNKIAQDKLSAKEMDAITGGVDRMCTCSCYWADRGGSSIEANGGANLGIGSGGYSEHGENEHVFMQ